LLTYHCQFICRTITNVAEWNGRYQTPYLFMFVINC